MLKSKYLYWASTGLLALFMLASGLLYFTAESAAANFERLGFPDYFRVELGVAKVLGALALVVPLPRAVKEWTYAGFAISFVSAIVAHVASGDPLLSVGPPLVALLLWGVSYATYHQHVLGGEARSSREG
jgi:uncharacterized membrane protein